MTTVVVLTALLTMPASVRAARPPWFSSRLRRGTSRRARDLCRSCNELRDRHHQKAATNADELPSPPGWVEQEFKAVHPFDSDLDISGFLGDGAHEFGWHVQGARQEVRNAWEHVAGDDWSSPLDLDEVINQIASMAQCSRSAQ